MILWILALYVLLSFIIAGHSAPVATYGGHSGFISIDCGASEGYVDELTRIPYQTDKGFIESGTNHEVGLKSSRFPYIQRQLQTLRSFPDGKRNCYTLKPKQEMNQKQKYMIRAIFAYQNYDYTSQPPTFALHLGVNYWTTIDKDDPSLTYREIIIQLTNGTVQVCLVHIGQGTPFINTLELRPLNNSLYAAPFPLSFRVRRDCRIETKNWARYKDDVYDRLWYRHVNPDLVLLKAQVKVVENSTYELPSEILLTACQSPNKSNILNERVPVSLKLDKQHYFFLHFAEIQKLPSGKKRILNVTIDDEYSLSQKLTLDYLKPVTLHFNKIVTTIYAHLTVRATADSYAPPIINAFEIFEVIPEPESPTNAKDVYAIMEIKRAYGISKISWQGDPCVPYNLAWEGVHCSSGNNTRIISLDLSNNELRGELPEFLASLPNLKFINVTGNKLRGSIPKALKENANLNISAAENPGLCRRDSCDHINKFVIPLSTSIGVLVLIAILSSMIWRLKKKRQDLSTKSLILKQKNREFSYSQVVDITNNFKTLIGEGGFGKVYLGTLEDGSQVAVKLLSASSKQGYKEFQSEAQLLTVIHHRNLVSLVGYCHEGNIKALIYEYVDNGDLGHLLEKNSKVLKWNERLQVAIDTAKGLEYLHVGCHTPIIHRDLKPSNILLNKFMVAKIADFGLSRAFINEGDSHLSTQPAGTPGYIDPEFQRCGQLNKESDIYSFGMILLQLITGHPPIKRGPRNITFILDWVQPKIECGDIKGIVDPRLAREFYVTSIWKVVEVAMLCVLPTPSQRPNISYILQELQECLALEMDHARIDNTMPSSSLLDYSVNIESMTILSAR
ncbi:putative leucine-rich repeat receptor-like serine/threonine-protein kinase At2g19230 isoform X2 [Prosopis cineraria]|uniref:putative leucine-rich repeat receptor-like serine/threonine-protein kinase At2g19230 isoform X2 n=1 Tax=Prosopis cineraria TaxID=364024 RepID=UPI0024101C67|nr:putative leucine-rich repeat receptor-like serine/threonine-protein kinase At2g19230 isoform X2 [Prosopis cineraria]